MQRKIIQFPLSKHKPTVEEKNSGRIEDTSSRTRFRVAGHLLHLIYIAHLIYHEIQCTQKREKSTIKHIDKHKLKSKTKLKMKEVLEVQCVDKHSRRALRCRDFATLL